MRKLFEHLVLLTLVVGVFFVTVSNSSSSYLIVVGDTCSFEVATSIIEDYGVNAIVIPYQQLSGIPEEATLVVLFTNATSTEGFEHVAELLKNSASRLVVTDIFYEYVSSKRGLALDVINIVPTEHMWRYCIYRDKQSLVIIEVALRPKPPISPYVLLTTVGGVIAVSASIHLSPPEVKEFVKRKFGKLLIAILSSFLLLHMKMKRDDLFKHPVRVEIVKKVSSRKEVAFSELLREIGCSRATLEWHLSLLVRAKVLEEVRIGKRRIYRIGANGVYITTDHQNDYRVR